MKKVMMKIRFAIGNFSLYMALRLMQFANFIVGAEDKAKTE